MLVYALQADQPAVQESVANASEILAGGSQHNKDAIKARGAVPLLVALLSSTQPAVRVSAFCALRALGFITRMQFLRSLVQFTILKLPLTFFEPA